MMSYRKISLAFKGRATAGKQLLGCFRQALAVAQLLLLLSFVVAFNSWVILLAGSQAMTQKQIRAQDQTGGETRPRARDVGLRPGILPPGKWNAITDVEGVLVGHTTLIEGENIRTGVTVILPHAGNLYAEKVPAGLHVGNGFGKFIGATQIEEMGEIETPIALTATLNVWRVADALVDYMLSLPGNEDIRSINPVVAETNDGYLNDIQARAVSKEHVLAAIRAARSGPVEEGCVGAGTGTMAFGFKAGIGTASRKLPPELGGWTVGVLVQSNFAGILTIDGAPVGKELGKYFLREAIEPQGAGSNSVIIVIATDAPLDAFNLKRMAARAMLGLGRTGAAATNGSGDYAIAFSTAREVRIRVEARKPRYGSTRQVSLVSNEAMSPLFLAVIEATEEAIYNSLFRACDMEGMGHRAEALPIEQTVSILKKYSRID